MGKDILFISAVNRNQTPVIESMISHLENNHKIVFIEYVHHKILAFIKYSLINILVCKNIEAIFFVGIQSLPILFLTQFLKIRKFYWSLESYDLKLINSSLVQKTLIFEYLIKWSRINLIIPSKYRLSHHNKKRYKKIFIIENAPRLGNQFKLRKLSSDRIRFVMYGRLNNEDIYLSEFIRIIAHYKDLAELHLIGWDFQLFDQIMPFSNIHYHGSKNHSDLVSTLEQYDISIIGYRPYKFNNKFCAPNKLYEAFSLSLPVILNSLNPPLYEEFSNNTCGYLVDFSELDEVFENTVHKIRSNYVSLNYNCFQTYIEKYNFENYIQELKINS
jgi:hypothetical protein